MKRRPKLLPDEARHIRETAYRRGWSARRVAQALDLSERTVQHIISGKTFQDAGGPIRKGRVYPRVLGPREVEKVRKWRGTRSSADIANEIGCSASLVRHVWTGRCHREDA